MILVDTSAWIDFFDDVDATWTIAVQEGARAGKIVVGDLVLVEVLQGIRNDARRRSIRAALDRFMIVSLCGPENAVDASDNYRLLRRRGITIRGTIDVIIATWCIANNAAIIHNDRDLAMMERELGLISYAG